MTAIAFKPERESGATPSASPYVVGPQRSYVTSEYAMSVWGQPAVSQYVFVLEGSILKGTMISSLPVLEAPTRALELALDRELAAWDVLSDEALEKFESELE